MYTTYLKHNDPYYIKVYKDDLIDEGYIILKENPHHEQGYMIEYMFKDIQDCIEKEFDKDIVYLDEHIIQIKGTKNHNRPWVTDLFEDYPQKKIDAELYNIDEDMTIICYSDIDDKVVRCYENII